MKYRRSQCRLLVRFRGTDVGEAIEPEGCSSRNLPNDVTRAIVGYFPILFIDKTFKEGAPLFGAIRYNAGGIAPIKNLALKTDCVRVMI